MKVVAFGDVHIGNIMSDLISFNKALDEALSINPDALVFVGDVIDGALKYGTQVFKQMSIRPIDIQRVMFKSLIVDKIVNSGSDVELVIARGNHDTNFIEDFLRPALAGIDLKYTYVNRPIIDGVMYTHYIVKRSRGSYATAITPMLVSMALSYSVNTNVRKFVFSHIHRGLSHIIVGGIEIIALPSFMRFEDAQDVMYSPCYAVIDNGEATFKCISNRPDIKDVEMFNTNLFNEALRKIISEEGQLYV